MMDEIKDPTIAEHKEEDTARLTQEGCAFTSGSSTTNKIRKVAIIGAGPSGLCAAKHLLAPGSGFTGCVYEQASDLGGTWLYTDACGKDKYGLPIHSTMYYNLWTNLPKETMTYPDFEYENEERSYLPASRVLQYLVDYADRYNLHSHIKLQHRVTRVAPVGNNWSVTAVELPSQLEHVTMFDAIVVCSGPTIIPVYPKVDGLARFSGRQFHSKEYRKAEVFQGKTVLVIGLGPSGFDITFQLEPIAKQVIISHNKPSLQGFEFPSSIKIKPIATSMEDKTVRFSDDTEEEVDVILHCTGYTYHYPFLTPGCGLIVDQYITPLYKHFINIEHPSMCIIGVPRKCPFQYMVDYQVRTFKNILCGDAKLPSKQDMINEMELDRKKRAGMGQRKKDYHNMNITSEIYFKELAELGGLDPIPPVILEIFSDGFKTAIKDFKNFRKTIYKIKDKDNFIKISEKESNDNLKLNGEQNVIVEVKRDEEISQIKDDDETNQEKGVEEITVISEKQNVEEEEQITETIAVTTEITETSGTIEVEAVVEVTPSSIEQTNNKNELNVTDEIKHNEENINLTINGGKVSYDIQDNPTKPTCGDEIVKIIQTEDGGGCR